MIKRNNYSKTERSIAKREISILIGARQVGKTTLLKKIFSEFRKSKTPVLYLNMDIESDAGYLQSQERLLSRIQLEFGDKTGYVCIDEIQQKEDAGRYLKGLYDMDLPYKFIVTGSGSLELKQRIGEALTGRKDQLHMETVSFLEFVDYKTEYKYSNRLEAFFRLEKEKTHSLLNEYLIFGGYPKVITSEGLREKSEVMKEIYTSYITKDISNLLEVRSTDKFTKMISLLAHQAGGIMNYAQLASDTGVSVDTLKNYLWYAEQTFIISLIKPFYSNHKKEITKSPVVYFNDLGMLNYASEKFGRIESDKGFVFQNFVFNLLRAKYESVTSPIRHWRSKDQAEVDFILRYEGEILPVEVKYSALKKPSVSRSLRSFIKQYQPPKAFVVSIGLESEIKIDNTVVAFIDFWKLCL